MSAIARYRDADLVVEAAGPLSMANVHTIAAWVGVRPHRQPYAGLVWIYASTPQGVVRVEAGDYVVRTPTGALLVCSAPVFEATYQLEQP